MGILPMDADILPPSDDRIFKLLLTAPEAEAGLMKLIEGIIGRGVVGVTVLNTELPATDTEEKSERFDVNCKIDDGSQINLEMQASHMVEDAGGEHRNLKGKSMYYISDLHAKQPSKGVRRYDRLAKSYQVTFCSYTVFPKMPDFVNSFSMRHDVTNELFSDAISVIYVELSKLGEIMEKAVEEMTVLEKWSVFFEYADHPRYRETVNRVIASEEVLQMAGDLLMSISKDEQERALFRSRRKFQTDYDSDMATSWDNGVLEGIAKGRANAMTDAARNLMKMSLTTEQIAQATGLSREEIEALK